MGYKMKGFGKTKPTDDSNNMTKGAAAMMNQSMAIAYKAPIKQVSGKGTATKRADYTYDAEGNITGIQQYGEAGKPSGSYRPTRKGAEMIKQGKGELFKEGAMSDYKGSIVTGEGGVIRGLKSPSGEFTRFENPTTRERLTKQQQKQLKAFERERDIYNRRQSSKREFVRKVKAYAGPYSPEKSPTQKKYKK